MGKIRVAPMPIRAESPTVEAIAAPRQIFVPKETGFGITEVTEDVAVTA
jgi:hypothetical protein